MNKKSNPMDPPSGYEVFCTSSAQHFYLPIQLADDLSAIQLDVMYGHKDKPEKKAPSTDHKILLETVLRLKNRKRMGIVRAADHREAVHEHDEEDEREEETSFDDETPKTVSFCGTLKPPPLLYSFEALGTNEDVRTFAQAMSMLDSMTSDHAYYNQPRSGEVRIFNSSNLRMACERMARDRERFTAFCAMLKKMARDNGYRKLIQITPRIESDLLDLKKRFLNFSHVIDRIMNQIMVWPYCREDQRRLTPILLEGPPGVGKSYFCEELAKVLNVDYKRLDCSSLTGGMALTGSTSHWGYAQPGLIVDAVASSRTANHMWFLDEINLASNNQRYPVMPVLLSMLEPQTAKCLRDDFCNLEFDISRNIFIAACNSTQGISSALISRFERFTIASPNTKQRKVVARSLIEQTFVSFEIDDDALDLISRLDLGLRELRRVVQQCGERLVMELRRGGHSGWQENQGKLLIREMHVRDVIKSNRYRLFPITNVEFDGF